MPTTNHTYESGVEFGTVVDNGNNTVRFWWQAYYLVTLWDLFDIGLELI